MEAIQSHWLNGFRHDLRDGSSSMPVARLVWPEHAQARNARLRPNAGTAAEGAAAGAVRIEWAQTGRAPWRIEFEHLERGFFANSFRFILMNHLAECHAEARFILPNKARRRGEMFLDLPVPATVKGNRSHAFWWLRTHYDFVDPSGVLLASVREPNFLTIKRRLVGNFPQDWPAEVKAFCSLC